jgi:hypothetical protein
MLKKVGNLVVDTMRPQISEFSEEKTRLERFEAGRRSRLDRAEEARFAQLWERFQ